MLTPMFPEELLPTVKEFRGRVKRLLGKPFTNPGDVCHLGDRLLVWWKENGEIGIGDASQKRFEPILVTINDSGRESSIMEWGSKEEIDDAMNVLKLNMVLDDLADA